MNTQKVLRVTFICHRNKLFGKVKGNLKHPTTKPTQLQTLLSCDCNYYTEIMLNLGSAEQEPKIFPETLPQDPPLQIPQPLCKNSTANSKSKTPKQKNVGESYTTVNLFSFWFTCFILSCITFYENNQ